MPRRSILTPAERESLLAIPNDSDRLISLYTLQEQDLSIIKQRRGAHNRLGFSVLLCYMRYPGIVLLPESEPNSALLEFLCQQLDLQPEAWLKYALRPETRREHLLELQEYFGFQAFTQAHAKTALKSLEILAQQTDKGFLLATELVQNLRNQSVLLPAISVLERVCAEAITRSTRQICLVLTKTLQPMQKRQLDDLLQLRPDSSISTLAWLRQPPGAPNPKHMLEHIDRLKTIENLKLPDDLGHQVHQNRLLKIAREGAQMTAQHLRDLEPLRRYATLVAVGLEARATLLDELVDLHERILGSLFNKAKRAHQENFQQSGKAINEKVRLYNQIGQALLEAKKTGIDPFSAIETVIPWDAFTRSVTEAGALAQPEDFDFLGRISSGYSQVRRYVPSLLETLNLKAAPAAQEILDGIHTLKALNQANARKVPEDAPLGFIRKRWEPLVFSENGIERRFYELCALTELKNGLRSGDISVQGSRQFKDFEEYLLPVSTFQAQQKLPLAIESTCHAYLEQRLQYLQGQLTIVEQLAIADQLPDVSIDTEGLSITPLDKAVPDEAEALAQKVYALLPRVKITELLTEVDDWTGFSQQFTHLKTNQPCSGQSLLLTTILADGINLGLAKMAEACPGSSYSKLTWIQAWHIRDETYSKALAELVNAQAQQPFAAWWGDGTTSSSDGQHFHTTGHSQNTGHVNLKYGQMPGKTIYTHLSDQYAPFHTQVINTTIRDATYVLDGLLYHESDLRIEEHYTDTAGFTDHVFALTHLLGFRFAPRIRDLADRRLYIPRGTSFPGLQMQMASKK
jgi:TnpA family transposase